MAKNQDDEVEPETEEEEQEEENLDFDEINKYYEDDEDNEEVEIDLEGIERPDFSKTSTKNDALGDLISQTKKESGGRYDTIELDEEDDCDKKGLEWSIDAVEREQDDEKMIDESIADVAMEFIVGQRQRRKHKKNQENFKETNRKEFDLPDELLFGSKKPKPLNKDLEDLKEYDEFALPDLDGEESPEIQNASPQEKKEPETDNTTEAKEYYDTNYWQDPYASSFKIEDLLQE